MLLRTLNTAIQVGTSNMHGQDTADVRKSQYILEIIARVHFKTIVHKDSVATYASRYLKTPLDQLQPPALPHMDNRCILLSLH